MKLIRDMDFKEIVDWATGQLIVSIGQGKFREEVACVLHFVIFETKQAADQKARK